MEINVKTGRSFVKMKPWADKCTKWCALGRTTFWCLSVCNEPFVELFSLLKCAVMHASLSNCCYRRCVALFHFRLRQLSSGFGRRHQEYTLKLFIRFNWEAHKGRLELIDSVSMIRQKFELLNPALNERWLLKYTNMRRYVVKTFN